MAEMYNTEAWNKIAGLYQRIAALEAELAAAQAAHAKSHEEAADWRRLHAELLMELAPWREMARQLEALRGEDWYWSANDFMNVAEDVTYRVAVYNDDRQRYQGEADTLPAAVNAAYGKVVGDE